MIITSFLSTSPLKDTSLTKTSGKKLRALWAAHVTGLLSEPKKIELLNHEDEYVRAWTVQLLCEDRMPCDKALKTFKKMAKEESFRISSEINISGACVANKGQLINTCKGQESQTGEKLGSNEQIKIEKIFYLGTFVKKLEEYKNYPNE